MSPSSPKSRYVFLALKALVTVAVFYVLLTHKIDAGDGKRIAIWDAITAHVGELSLRVFVPFVIAGALIKFVGIFASISRWHLLLVGQGIRFNFGHVVGSFLIGRFLGTFLPSTVGLDGYKLYDAARFSQKVIEPAAATAVEKVMGLTGVFLTFLVTLPLGYQVLGQNAAMTIAISTPVALCIVVGSYLVLFRPGLLQRLVRALPAFGRTKVESFLERVSQATTAYRGRSALLGAVLGLSFLVHFCTAAMYYFMALAVGAAQAEFWPVTFASTIQIVATVLSPVTIAGEGVREAVQALLLARHIGVGASVLSAALGFWAAEALTLVGAFFWWARGTSYQPRSLTVLSPHPPCGHPLPQGERGSGCGHDLSDAALGS